jgi:hypothetical protein
MRGTTRLLLVAVLASTATVAVPLPAQAAPTAKVYANCTAIHRDYTGGIAKAGVKYNRVSGVNRALKGKVKFSTDLYKANIKSDRDRDGIACEKS